MRRIVPYLLGVMMVLMAGLGPVGCEGGSDGDDSDSMTQERWFDTVRVGMTEAEVNAALGRPPDREFSMPGQSTRYSWRYGNAEGSVTYDGNRRVSSTAYSPDMYGSGAAS